MKSFSIGDRVLVKSHYKAIDGKEGVVADFLHWDEDSVGVILDNFNVGHHNFGLEGLTVNSGWYCGKDELILIGSLCLENK